MNYILEGEIHIRPRYNEVDQMGYVYHDNYVTYCHQARTELLRKLGIHDNKLEKQNIMLPVISMDLKYHKPAGYDELLTIRTRITDIPTTRFNFEFEIRNEKSELVCSAKSTVVFVDSQTRKPMRAPKIVTEKIKLFTETLSV